MEDEEEHVKKGGKKPSKFNLENKNMEETLKLYKILWSRGRDFQIEHNYVGIEEEQGELEREERGQQRNCKYGEKDFEREETML